MQAAKAPRPKPNHSFFRGGIRGGEPTSPATRIDFAFEAVAQGIQHTRHGNRDRGALLLDGTKYFRRQRRIFKHNGRAKKRRNEKRHELAKHMAERNGGNEPQRMNPALVTAIFVDALFEGLEVREEVAVGKHHAARLAGGARSKQDFRHVAARGLDRWAPLLRWLAADQQAEGRKQARVAQAQTQVARSREESASPVRRERRAPRIRGSRPHPWAPQLRRAAESPRSTPSSCDGVRTPKKNAIAGTNALGSQRMLKIACACSSE